jgi:hypothetical protein
MTMASPRFETSTGAQADPVAAPEAEVDAGTGGANGMPTTSYAVSHLLA